MKVKKETEILRAIVDEYQEKEKQSEIIFKDFLKLRENLDFYKQNYEKLQNDKDSVLSSIIIKEKQFSDRENGFLKQIENLQKDNIDLKNKHDILTEKNDLLKVNLETLQTSGDIERSRIRDKSEEICDLKKQLEEIFSRNKYIEEEYGIKLDNLSKENEIKESQCVKLLNQLDIQEKQKDNLAYELDASTNKYKTLSSSNAELENSIAKCSEKLQEKCSEFEVLKKHFHEFKTDSEKKEQSYKVTFFYF